MAKIKKPKLPRSWSGRVLTDEIADQLADEIESTEAFKWERRRPVGPLRAEDEIIPLIGLRIPTELRSAVRARANQQRRTVSDLTCEALEKYLGET